MIVYLAAGFAIGCLVGAAVLFHMLPRRLKQHIDYKERWKEALDLLTQEGKITDEQVRHLLKVKAPQPVPQPQPKIAGGITQRQLYQLPSWSRTEIEVKRAQMGLIPADDLRGLPSWSVTEILKARASAELRRIREDI